MVCPGSRWRSASLRRASSGSVALVLCAALAIALTTAWYPGQGANTFSVPTKQGAANIGSLQHHAGSPPADVTDRSTFAGRQTLDVDVHHGHSRAGVQASAGPASRLERAQDGSLVDGVSLFLSSASSSLAISAMRAVNRAATFMPAPGWQAGNRWTTLQLDEELKQKVKVPFLLFLWYAFNIGYNIYNKKALMAYPYPWAIALWQMFAGCLVFVPLWLLGLKPMPRMTPKQMLTLSPSTLGHLATHVGAVVAFSAGAVSFGHIVKASEPVISCVLNGVFLGEVLPGPVYAALLPIIGGVALASASEMSFNWLSFGAAMASNVGSAARGVYSKKMMKGADIGENMTASNMYAVLTLMATLALLPIACLMEGPAAMAAGFQAAYGAGGPQFLWSFLGSGLFYYAYNEVAFQALGELDPVSHAVSNTMKRVVIIIAAIFVFRNPVTPLGIAGSGIAIAGTLLYSLAKDKCQPKPVVAQGAAAV
eukprot:TRINITY_DN111263_c0_g1_i1.p1 TRINITY_DN111263_c0_g1~~TRINITY_DN111263_c0_g1_i1.p1  ORF type:complete len:481 (-),score=102.80 TRINITY_DN111263_c0_g1_i1:117-1559(-)